MRRSLLLLPLVVAAAACARPAPQQKLSTVLAAEHIDVPKGATGPVAEPEVRVSAVTAAPTDFEGIPIGITPEGRPMLGADAAQIVIHMFSDLQCPYCGRAHSQLVEWVRRHPGEIQVVFFHFPLSMHQHAAQYAREAHCAGEQGKFWHVIGDLYRAGYQPVGSATLAKRHALDLPSFQRCVSDQTTQQAITRDLAEGNRLQVRGTPTFFVDGVQMNSVDLENLLKAKLKE
jgi:protein-disulfide isomerase